MVFAAAVLAATAQAEPIKPHSPTHVLTPAPAPSPSAAPGLSSVPAPAPNSAPVPNAGPGTSGGAAQGVEPVKSSGSGKGRPSTPNPDAAEQSRPDPSLPFPLIEPEALKDCDLNCVALWRQDAWAAYVNSGGPVRQERYRELTLYLQGRMGELAPGPPDYFSMAGDVDLGALMAALANAQAAANSMLAAKTSLAVSTREQAAAAALAAARERARLADEYARAQEPAAGDDGGSANPGSIRLTDQVDCSGAATIYSVVNWLIEDGGGAIGDC